MLRDDHALIEKIVQADNAAPNMVSAPKHDLRSPGYCGTRLFHDMSLKDAFSLGIAAEGLAEHYATRCSYHDNRTVFNPIVGADGKLLSSGPQHARFLKKQDAMLGVAGRTTLGTADIRLMYPSFTGTNTYRALDSVHIPPRRVDSVTSGFNFKYGLPIGHVYSDTVSRLSLSPLDDHMAESGAHFLRYQDDMRFFSTTVGEVTQRFAETDRIIATVGLSRNLSKSFVLTDIGAKLTILGMCPDSLPIDEYVFFDEDIEPQIGKSNDLGKFDNGYGQDSTQGCRAAVLDCDRLWKEHYAPGMRPLGPAIERVVVRDLALKEEGPLTSALCDLLLARPYLASVLGQRLLNPWLQSELLRYVSRLIARQECSWLLAEIVSNVADVPRTFLLKKYLVNCSKRWEHCHASMRRILRLCGPSVCALVDVYSAIPGKKDATDVAMLASTAQCYDRREREPMRLILERENGINGAIWEATVAATRLAA